jgi:hypothetical protein
MALRLNFRHTQPIVSNEEEDETIVIGPPASNGDDWDLTPQLADELDEACIRVLPVGQESEGP